MTVYDTDTLNNLTITKHSTDAAAKGLISQQEFDKIKDAHPVDFYTPNLSAKIGLGILTFLIALSASCFILLLFQTGQHLSGYLIFMALVCYIVLERFTAEKKHYNSGVDNVLMFTIALFIATAISFYSSVKNVEIIVSLVLFAVSAWFTIRFTDSFAAAVSAISLLTFIFDAYAQLGEGTISTFPFLLIITSAAMYYFSKKACNSPQLLLYYRSLQNISYVALLSFYLSGNYWVVEQLTKTSYLLQSHSPLTMSWFFWSWTMLVPVFILIRGWLKREIIFIRAGLLLVLVSLITFKTYFYVMSTETAMVTGGAVILLIAYLLTRYLKTAKNGFVFDDNALKEIEYNTFEALIPAVLHGEHTADNHSTKFGGGGFGGAGAEGNY